MPLCSDSEIRKYLHTQYAGVFSEASIEFHLKNHVGFGFAEGVLSQVAQRVPARGRILDIGAGFGSFVIAARRLGLDAVGIEIAPFEVDYARQRVAEEFPGLNPYSVFFLADGHELPFSAGYFDSVTLWNVLEHVSDVRKLLKQVALVLRPGGWVYLICPNYAAFRREAHYQVYWFPLMPRKIARAYLRWLGKNPSFFESSIFYSTNWGVLQALRYSGFRIEFPGDTIQPKQLGIGQEIRTYLTQPNLVQNPKKQWVLRILKSLHLTSVILLGYCCYNQARLITRWVRRAITILELYNPLKSSIILCARKENQ